jgi:hypothetical protein
MISNLHSGRKLTIFTIDSILAMTHRKFIEIRTVEKEPKRMGYDNNLRLGTYRERGARPKEFFFDLPSDALVFDGWDVPFTADTDGGGMISGNACFNLVGDPAVIRDWIETKQLNSEVGDGVKGTILVWPEDRSNIDVEPKLLYPELETRNSVIDDLKEKPV